MNETGCESCAPNEADHTTVVLKISQSLDTISLRRLTVQRKNVTLDEVHDGCTTNVNEKNALQLAVTASSLFVVPRDDILLRFQDDDGDWCALVTPQASGAMASRVMSNQRVGRRSST